MDAKTIIDSMLKVAESTTMLVVSGSEPGFKLASSVIEMIDHAKEQFGAIGEDLEKPLADLMAQRDSIEARVNHHVDLAIHGLRGDDAPTE